MPSISPSSTAAATGPFSLAYQAFLSTSENMPSVYSRSLTKFPQPETPLPNVIKRIPSRSASSWAKVPVCPYIAEGLLPNTYSSCAPVTDEGIYTLVMPRM